MHTKNNISLIEKQLKNKKQKIVAMLAPSFVAEFDYPDIIHQLKALGFDKVVELTFGAKMINREYHKQLEAEKYKNKNLQKLIISSACAGISEIIPQKFPKLKNNLINVDSPMTATAKICKKIYPKHKTLFISPCQFKKTEAEKSKFVDYAVDYQQLHNLFKKYKIKEDKKKSHKKNHQLSLLFNRFYNDYTKIYPLSGGLSKTAHLKGAVKKSECRIIGGIKQVEKFLNKPQSLIRFLDATFCTGGCIGGPYLSKALTLAQKKKRVLHYINVAKQESIPENRKGLIEVAKAISFTR